LPQRIAGRPFKALHRRWVAILGPHQLVPQQHSMHSDYRQLDAALGQPWLQLARTPVRPLAP